MAKRPALGNRLKIEAALSPAQRSALAEDCLLRHVRPDRWQAVGELLKYQVTAALSVALELRTDDPTLSVRASIREACQRLELPSPSTIRTALDRAARSRRVASC